MNSKINKKKVKVSKNRKKSWRKHTNIQDLEDFLDDKRFEERIGHSIIDAKDEDLFKIEKFGENLPDLNETKIEILEQNQNDNDEEKQSKLQKIISSHRFFQKLDSTSKVPPILIQKRGKQKKTVYNDDDKLKKYWKDKQILIEKLNQLKENQQKVLIDPKLRFKNNYDLWNDDGDGKNQQNTNSVKVPEHLRQKPSLIPAVEVPLPGQSYNPSEQDYKLLISEEIEKEMQLINEEKRLSNKIDKYFLTKSEAKINEKQWLEEMSQGLFETKSTENDGDDEIENDEIDPELFNNKKSNKKKTKSQKRRELKEKLAKKKKEQEKLIRIKENQVFRIKSFQKEIKQREEKLKEKAKIRQEKHLESLFKPKRLSRYQFEEPIKEINLTDDLTGQLRSIKTEGNILMDRFKSFQKRNIIEPRVRQFHKRNKNRKKEIKRRFKDNPNNNNKEEIN